MGGMKTASYYWVYSVCAIAMIVTQILKPVYLEKNWKTFDVNV